MALQGTADCRLQQVRDHFRFLLFSFAVYIFLFPPSFAATDTVVLHGRMCKLGCTRMCRTNLVVIHLHRACIRRNYFRPNGGKRRTIWVRLNLAIGWANRQRIYRDRCLASTQPVSWIFGEIWLYCFAAFFLLLLYLNENRIKLQISSWPAEQYSIIRRKKRWYKLAINDWNGWAINLISTRICHFIQKVW